jgi:hypothetical protein
MIPEEPSILASAVDVAKAPEISEPAVSKNLFDPINILLPAAVDRAL